MRVLHLLSLTRQWAGFAAGWLGILTILTLLAGCGYKGPLQLPDKQQDKQQQEQTK